MREREAMPSEYFTIPKPRLLPRNQNQKVTPAIPSRVKHIHWTGIANGTLEYASGGYSCSRQRSKAIVQTAASGGLLPRSHPGIAIPCATEKEKGDEPA